MRNVVLFLLLLMAPAAEALDVAEVRWGFDGRAVPDWINPVSILLVNSSNKPYEGLLALSKSDAFGTRLGARVGNRATSLLRPAAGSNSMSPSQETEETLDPDVGRRCLRAAALPVARLGPPATVMLDDPDQSGHGAAPIPRLSDELFPTDVTGLDGLHSVLLDHAPRWEPARRQAFLDWLRCGGVVHVLHGEDGKFPVFP